MASLYNISNKLINLFADIEAGGGEITEEQISHLAIAEEELKEKLDNYYKAILEWNADAAKCKEEEKRIAAVRKKYENRVNHLKTNMLAAVKQFGEEGKHNKFIELPSVRLFTKGTPAVDVNTARIDALIFHLDNIVRELVNNDMLDTNDEIDFEGLLAGINANCRAELGDDYEPYTMEDLLTLQLNVSVKLNAADLFTKGVNVLKGYVNNPLYGKIEDATSKDEWKSAIKVADNTNGKITLASIIVNESIQMK